MTDVESAINAASGHSVQSGTPPTKRNAFVGRRNERRQFAAAVEACVEGGYGQSFLLRGETGIGKTRLVQEYKFIAELRGFTCHPSVTS